MKDAKRRDVENFLKQQGYQVGRDKGRHTKISAGVLRDIEKTIGHVPDAWK